jgi:hypothetical protein
MTGTVPEIAVRIEHEHTETEQVPIAAFVRANWEDAGAMDALAGLINRLVDEGRSGEAVIGGGATPMACLSLVDVYPDRPMTPGERSYSLSCTNGSVYRD